MPSFVGKIASGLQERFASTWLLLSDTTNFLSRTSIFAQYEGDLMELRRRLSSSRKSAELEREVRKELVAIRESVRLQGYDLGLGRLELSIEGFRNDASFNEGFLRLVVFIGRRGLWKISGEANHLELHRALERSLEGREDEIVGKHYLWYRWIHQRLVLSGSDTESKDDFESFKAWCALPEHSLLLLGAMRKLR